MRQTHRSQHTTPRTVIRVIPIEIPLVCVRDPTNLPVTICLPFASQNCVIISGYVEAKATVSSRRLRRIRQMSALWPNDGNWRSRNLLKLCIWHARGASTATWSFSSSTTSHSPERHTNWISWELSQSPDPLDSTAALFPFHGFLPVVLYHYTRSSTHPGGERMADLSAVLAQLKKERDRLDRAIAALSGVGTRAHGGRTGVRRLSAAARKRIADAQRARWAKFRKTKKAA